MDDPAPDKETLKKFGLIEGADRVQLTKTLSSENVVVDSVGAVIETLRLAEQKASDRAKDGIAGAVDVQFTIKTSALGGEIEVVLKVLPPTAHNSKGKSNLTAFINLTAYGAGEVMEGGKVSCRS